ncbi:MAG: hypothetical protein O2904_04080 [bacterium]|nr:hypothetical protein [bacterium]
MAAKKKTSSFSLSLSPTFVQTLVVVIAVVFVWRGIWNLIDIYLFPGNPLLSNVVSILLGIFLLYLPNGNISELR